MRGSFNYGILASAVIFFANYCLGQEQGSKDAGNLLAEIKMIPRAPVPEPASAASCPVLQCKRTGTKPVIDGKLNDPCWQNAVAAGDFSLHGTKNPAGQQTSVRIAYDDNNLYLAYVCNDSEMGKMKAESGLGGATPVWGNDCIELYLDPMLTGKICYQFEVDSLGQIWDARLEPETNAAVDRKMKCDSGWNSGIQAATSKENNRWIVEMSLPVAKMEVDKIRDGNIWGVSLTRSAVGHKEDSSWVPWTYGGNFGTPEYFGKLVLGEGAWQLDKVKSGTPLMGGNRLTAKVRRTAGDNGKAELRAEVSEDGKEAKTYTSEVTLPGNEERECTLNYNIANAGGNVTLKLTFYDQSSRDIAAIRFDRFVVPIPLEVNVDKKLDQRRGVNIEAKISAGEEIMQKGCLELGLYDGAQLLRAGKIKGPLSSRLTARLNTEGIKEGKYRLTTQLLNDTGVKLTSVENTVVLVSNPFDW